MKSRLLILAAFFVCTGLTAQSFKIGIRGGINSSQIKLKDVADSRYEIDYAKGEIGYHFGVITQLKVLGLYVQPELLFTTAKNDIKVTDLLSNNSDIGKQKFYKLDVPIIAGFKLGPLKLQAGPVATMMLGTKYKFEEDLYNLDDTYSGATIGYQAGIGLELSSLLVDVKYEGNLSSLGTGVKIGGSQFDFDQRMHQWIFSVGYLF